MSRGLEIELRAGKITQTLSNSTSTVSLQSTKVLNEVLCVQRQKCTFICTNVRKWCAHVMEAHCYFLITSVLQLHVCSSIC